MTKTEIRVRAGLSRRNIPIAAVTRAEPHRFRSPIPIGIVVHFEEGGRTRSCWVASRDPDALLAAIETARAGGSPKLRVAPENDDASLPEGDEVEDARSDDTSRRA